MKLHALVFAVALGFLAPAGLAQPSADEPAGTVIAALPSGSPAVMLNRALAWQNAGKYAEAVREYDLALGADGLSDKARAIAFYNRGLSRQALGGATGAVSDFTRALMIDPSLAEAYFSRANVFLSHGRADLALADYREAIRHRYPQPQLALLGEARALAGLGLTGDARRSLERALVLSPGLVQARTELEVILRDQVGLADIDPNALRPVLADVDPEPISGLVGDLVTELPEVKFSDLRLPRLMRAPDNMLDAAAMVQHSRIRVSSLLTLVLSETPALEGPGLTVADTLSRPKVQDRVAEITDTVLPLPKFIRVEAAAASTGVAEKAMKIPELPKPVLSPFVLLGGREKTEADAWKLWDKIKSSEDELLAGKDANVVPVKVKGKTVYRLQVNGIASKKDGAGLCRSLKPTLGTCEVNPRG